MPRSSFNRDLLTGLVALAAIAGLVVMMWRFGELYRFTRKSYPLYVRMTAVNGLSSTSGVTLKGVRIGAISDIETTNEGVLITMQIREPNKVPKGMTVYIDRSFVGEGSLDFRPPTDPAALTPNVFLEQGDIIPEASQPPIFAASLFSELNDTIKGPIQSMGKAAERIETLAISLEETSKKFSEMIEPRTLAEVDSGAKQPNLRSALARADLAIASANKWLGDDSALADAKSSLSKLNRMIYEDVKEDMFISLAYVMLQGDSGQVVLARAGHDAPFLYQQATGEISRLEPPGLALGLDDGDVFDRVTKDLVFEMKTGDCLLLYTDGINEAENAAGDQFGLDRLQEVFRCAAPEGPAAVLRSIQDEVQAHVQGHPQSDDITVIAIQRK